MTVGDLIYRLQELPRDLEVFTCDFYEDRSVEMVDVIETPMLEEYRDVLGRKRQRTLKPIQLRPSHVMIR